MLALGNQYGRVFVWDIDVGDPAQARYVASQHAKPALVTNCLTFRQNYFRPKQPSVLCSTVGPLLKDHAPLAIKMWSLKTGGLWWQIHNTLKWRSFCQKLVVLQDMWSLVAVVSQDRFHCTVLISLCLLILCLLEFLQATVLGPGVEFSKILKSKF